MDGIVELFAFSNTIDVWIELWCDVKDSAPFYTIRDSINQKVIKLFNTNWSHTHLCYNEMHSKQEFK